MLGLSATVRASLLAPHSGAATLLSALADCFSDQQAAELLCHAFAEAGSRGVVLMTDVMAGMRDVAAMEEELTALQLEAGQTLQHPRTIKFQRASEIWKNWLRLQGLLGEALDIVARADHSRAEEVAQRVLELRAKGSLNRELADADRAFRGAASHALDGEARRRILYLTEGVLDTLSRWANLVVEIHRARELSEGNDWQHGPLSALRERVKLHGPTVDDWLVSLSNVGLPEERAAAAAARGSLLETFALLDGQPLPGDERLPLVILNAELLKSPSVSLDDYFQANNTPSLDQVLEAAVSSWTTAIVATQGRGFHRCRGDLVA